jgi:hypothetical protein
MKIMLIFNELGIPSRSLSLPSSGQGWDMRKEREPYTRERGRRI